MSVQGTPNTHQEEKSIRGDSLTKVGDYYAIVDRAGNDATARGVRIQGGSAGGDLKVHLLKDDDGAGTDEYEVYDFVARDKEGLRFDSIQHTGTTIALADVLILLD